MADLTAKYRAYHQYTGGHRTKSSQSPEPVPPKDGVYTKKTTFQSTAEQYLAELSGNRYTTENKTIQNHSKIVHRPQEHELPSPFTPTHAFFHADQIIKAVFEKHEIARANEPVIIATERVRERTRTPVKEYQAPRTPVKEYQAPKFELETVTEATTKLIGPKPYNLVESPQQIIRPRSASPNADTKEVMSRSNSIRTQLVSGPESADSTTSITSQKDSVGPQSGRRTRPYKPLPVPEVSSAMTKSKSHHTSLASEATSSASPIHRNRSFTNPHTPVQPNLYKPLPGEVVVRSPAMTSMLVNKQHQSTKSLTRPVEDHTQPNADADTITAKSVALHIKDEMKTDTYSIKLELPSVSDTRSTILESRGLVDVPSNISEMSAKLKSSLEILAGRFRREAVTIPMEGLELIVKRSASPIRDAGSILDSEQQVLQEISESEINYLDDVQLILEVFAKPFKEMVEVKDYQILFSSLPQILVLHNAFTQDLRSTEALSRAFSRMAEYFKLYIAYATNFPMALNTLHRISRSEPQRSYLENVYGLPSWPAGQTLENLLLKPIQRICKYPLLLTGLRKRISTSHKSCIELEHTISIVSKVMEQINMKVQQAENTLQALDVASRLRGCPFELLDPTRSLVFQGYVCQSIYSSKVGRVENVERHLIVFNDCAVLAKKARSGWGNKDQRFEYVDAILFEDGIKVNLDEEDHTVFELIKVASGTSWRLQTEQRTAWINAIERCGIKQNTEAVN